MKVAILVLFVIPVLFIICVIAVGVASTERPDPNDPPQPWWTAPLNAVSKPFENVFPVGHLLFSAGKTVVVPPHEENGLPSRIASALGAKRQTRLVRCKVVKGVISVRCSYGTPGMAKAEHVFPDPLHRNEISLPFFQEGGTVVFNCAASAPSAPSAPSADVATRVSACALNCE